MACRGSGIYGLRRFSRLPMQESRIGVELARFLSGEIYGKRRVLLTHTDRLGKVSAIMFGCVYMAALSTSDLFN